MAKYDVECPECGETYAVQLYGKHREREWKLDNWDWTCDECKEKARQEENAKAAAANAEAGLPSLIGSEKMIAWAETIRKQKLATLDEEIFKRPLTADVDAGRLNAAIDSIKNKTSGRWWIDNRDTRILYLLREEYQATEKPLPPEEKKIAEEAKVEALAEATVRPEKPATETVAEIRIDSAKNTIRIVFPEKLEDFRQIVRFKLGYLWDKTAWIRTIKPTNGTIEDRVAEAGNRLLAAGFPIRIFDENLRVRAVYGHYEQESYRWVMALTSGTHTGWFCIKWPRGEDFFRAAKKLRGSRYEKPYIVVPPEQFQEVLDFAEMYEFAVSEGAKKIIDTAKTVRENALTAPVSKKEDRKLPEPGDKPAPIAVPENVDIDDEFKEEV